MTYDYEDRFNPNWYQLSIAEVDFLYREDRFSFWRMGGYSDDFGNLFFTTRVNPYEINWVSRPHSTCSMLKSGWAPPWVSQEEVREMVNGTFGGRFSRFTNKGQFVFVAYTD